MKTLAISNILGDSGMIIDKETLQHILDAPTQVLKEMLKGNIATAPEAGKLYVCFAAGSKFTINNSNAVTSASLPNGGIGILNDEILYITPGVYDATNLAYIEEIIVNKEYTTSDSKQQLVTRFIDIDTAVPSGKTAVPLVNFVDCLTDQVKGWVSNTGYGTNVGIVKTRLEGKRLYLLSSEGFTVNDVGGIVAEISNPYIDRIASSGDKVYFIYYSDGLARQGNVEFFGAGIYRIHCPGSTGEIVVFDTYVTVDSAS